MKSRPMIRRLACLALASAIGWFGPSSSGEEPVLPLEAAHAAESEEVRGTLETIHEALVSYLGQNEGVWPQVPDDVMQGDPDAYLEWWKQTLELHGMPRDRWELEGNPDPGVGANFVVSLFSKGPLTAYRWYQPWCLSAVKLGDKSVTYVLMPDGRIFVTPLQKLPSAKEIKWDETRVIPPSLRKFDPAE